MPTLQYKILYHVNINKIKTAFKQGHQNIRTLLCKFHDLWANADKLGTDHTLLF